MQIMKQLEEIGQACKDVAYLDFDMLDKNGEDLFSNNAVTKFVDALPEQEKADLIDIHGYPNSTATSRMMAAVMLKGYYSDALINLAYKPLSGTSGLIFNALAYAAKEMEALNDAPDGLDIRDFLAKSSAGLIHDLESVFDLNFFKDLYLDTEYEDDCEKSNFAWEIAILQHVDNLDDLKELFVTDIAGVLVNLVNKINRQNLSAEIIPPADDICPKSELLKLSKEEPACILPYVYKSKMSCYMSSYWSNYGLRFFDKNTCQDFLNDLNTYRKKLNRCK